MFKTILILSKLALLLSKYYILNIEQGGEEVSEYIDAMIPFKWGSYDTKMSYSLPIKHNSPIPLFKKQFKSVNPDVLPNISITLTFDDIMEKHSFDLKKCDTCLTFNFIDQNAVKHENVDCSLTYPGKEFSPVDIKDDQFIFDKVLNFGLFNIVLYDGKPYFVKHDGQSFSTYVDLSSKLANKTVIDILSFERSDVIYILCHTKEEIYVFTIKSIDNKYQIDILHTVNKAEKGLTYDSIVTFGSTENSLMLVYKETEIAYAIVYKDKTEVKRSQIVDHVKAPLKIHDAKISTATGHIFIIVKGKGLYAYNVNKDEINTFMSHPYLAQLDKVSRNQDPLYEYLGVYVDQGHNNVKEVLIEFLFKPDDRQLYLNKVFTTNGLKFRSSFIATKEFYGLSTQDTLYLLPARSPSRIFTLGTKVPLGFKEVSVVNVIETLKTHVYLATSQKNTKVLYENQRRDREFACTFKKDEECDIEWLASKATRFTAVDTEELTYKFKIEEEEIIEAEGGLSIGIILLIVGIVLIVIGAGVGCYIRRKNAIHNSRNAQLL
jgi:hypothetical protein